MDETDSTFVDVIKANDQKTATTMLTEWGINNNASTLLDKVTDEIGQALGAGQVVRGVSTFVEESLKFASSMSVIPFAN